MEADGKPDGKIPLQKFAEILDCDPIWKVRFLSRLISRAGHASLFPCHRDITEAKLQCCQTTIIIRPSMSALLPHPRRWGDRPG